MKLNMSLVTNLVSVGLIGVGYAIPSSFPIANPIRQIGLYATSGAITNWLAIYMLFQRIPGLYGSGVIPGRFQEFKLGIRNLIMNEFFTREQVESFFHSHSESSKLTLDPAPILNIVDYNAMFEQLVKAVLASPFGGMLGMFGGPKALEPLRQPFEENIRQGIQSVVSSPLLGKAIETSINLPNRSEEIVAKVEAIVQKRLNELTPAMVKDIVQEMIREHLGWLVVWGGVLGGLIGLVASLIL